MNEDVICPKCGYTITAEWTYCLNCGTHRPADVKNHCINPACKMHIQKYNFPPNAKNCGECGGLTTHGKEMEDLL